MKTQEINDRLISAIIESVKEGGAFGAPSGHIYAAFSSIGCPLDAYEILLARAVKTGKIKKRGHLLFYVETAEREQ